jgi:elongation factor Ts
MVVITAAQVKELRDATNVSMMECKKALVETNGDLAAATRALRERGMAVAAKKASRTANQGLVATAAAQDGRIHSLVEVNCETDFVARNATFLAFVAEMAVKACESDESLAETMKDTLTAKIAEIGENLVIRRNTRFRLEGTGAIEAYIHLNSKIGVLVDLGCAKPESVAREDFRELLNDLCLHIAACAPQYLEPSEIPADVLQAEREIYAKQMEGKPAAVIDKIVDGKMQKYYSEVCLRNQPFVREPKQSIDQRLAEQGKIMGDTLTLRRFVRYQVGQ